MFCMRGSKNLLFRPIHEMIGIFAISSLSFSYHPFIPIFFTEKIFFTVLHSFFVPEFSILSLQTLFEFYLVFSTISMSSYFRLNNISDNILPYFCVTKASYTAQKFIPLLFDCNSCLSIYILFDLFWIQTMYFQGIDVA